jgi:protein phosphatase-4 regulatory subunit 3
VLSRVLDEGTFGILNGFIYFSQVDVVTHIQNNDAFLVELLGIFKNLPVISTSPSTAESLAENSLSDQKKRDTVMFLHQLFTLAKPMQVMSRLALYRGLVDRGLLHVVEWAFRQREASVLHTASEILTFALEHDTNMVRGHILKEHDAGVPTLLVEIRKVQHATENSGLASHLTDNIRHLLDMPNETEVGLPSYLEGNRQSD